MPRLKTCAWCEALIKPHNKVSYKSSVTGRTYYFNSWSCRDAFVTDARRDNS